MDENYDTFGTHGRQTYLPTYLPTYKAHLQQNLAELHKTIDRLHELRVEYLALLESVHKNLRDSKDLVGRK